MDAEEPTGSGVGNEGNGAAERPAGTDSLVTRSLANLTAIATLVTSLVVIGVLTKSDVHRDWTQLYVWIQQHLAQLRWSVLYCGALYLGWSWNYKGFSPPGGGFLWRGVAAFYSLITAWLGLNSFLNDYF